MCRNPMNDAALLGLMRIALFLHSRGEMFSDTLNL